MVAENTLRETKGKPATPTDGAGEDNVGQQARDRFLAQANLPGGGETDFAVLQERPLIQLAMLEPQVGAGKDQGPKPSDGKDDKPRSPAEEALLREAKDGLDRGALLNQDSLTGAWSPKSQETWRRIFDDISKQPGMTDAKMVSALKGVGALINKSLKEKNVEHTVGMVVKKGEDGQTTIVMQINNPKNQEDNRQAALEGKDTPTSARAGSISEAEGRRNAVGAYVKTDKDGRIEYIERKDKSRVVPKWEADAQGKKGSLAGFNEITPDGRTRSWTREGDHFSTGADANKQVVKNVQFENNGNFSFTDDIERSFTVRGNGAILDTGRSAPQYQFDEQGRIKNITPIGPAWDLGAPSMAFTYVGNTDKLQSVGELTKADTLKRRPGTIHLAKDGEILADNGDHKYPEVFKVGGKDLSVTHVHHPGTIPDADDRQKVFLQSDGTKAITHFNAQGKFASVEGFSKDGRPQKAYSMVSDKQIAELDPLAGNLTLWNKGEDNKWHGKQTREAGKQVDKDKGIRQNLDFNNLAELRYIDDKGARHTDYKDGRTETERMLPNGTYTVTDEKGRLTKSGMVTSTGADHNKYLLYKYSDTPTADGQYIPTEAIRVNNGQEKTVWPTSEEGRTAAQVSESGELAFIAKDGQKVLIRPDQSLSKYKLGEGEAPDLLSEISFPDGSQRTFKYGELTDPRHPIEIASSSQAPNGDTIIRTFTAMPPLEPAAKGEAAKAGEADKAKGPAKVNDLLSSVQLWKMTEEKIPKVDDKKTDDGVPARAKSEVKAAPVFALELFANGDFEATSTATDKSRYLFPARGMKDIPMGKPVQLDGPDGRVLRAKQYLDDVYTKDVLPVERKSMEPRLLIEDRLVDRDSLDKDAKLVAMFADKYITEKLGVKIPQWPADARTLTRPQQEQLLTDAAYSYELAAAIIEGRKVRITKSAK